MSQVDTLFRPVDLGKLSLKNRIAMAPMTRTYSPGNVPNSKVVDYYRRRAEGDVGSDVPKTFREFNRLFTRMPPLHPL